MYNAQESTINLEGVTNISLEGMKENVDLPSSWIIQSSSTGVSFVKLQEESTSSQPCTISHALRIVSNMSWFLTINGHRIEDDHCLELFGVSTRRVSTCAWELLPYV